jgi:hypothetical protein
MKQWKFGGKCVSKGTTVPILTVPRGPTIYRLHLVGLQEVRMVGSVTKPAGEYIFFCGNEVKIMN